MATTDDLIISIRADVNQLNTQLNDVNNRLRDTERNGNKAGDALKDMAKGLLALFGAMGGLEKLIQVNREFGILKAGLETATGSLEGATEAFGALQQFAQETPYALSQAVDGFTKLVNLGLTPSERALKSYGDTSAALGKDLSQMIEAVADAATGEFERLKEFGIKSNNQGDTIAFTFKGTTETVKNNAAAIEEYLIKMGEINFDGAMKKRMDSLDGAISNLGDTWDNFFYQLGQAGATDLLKSSFGKITESIASVSSSIEDIPTSTIKEGFDTIADAALMFAGYMATKVAISIGLSTQEFIKNIAAQNAARMQTLANAEADAAASGIAARRAIVEKELTLDQLARARSATAAALATQQSTIADLEAAQMQSRLAAGTSGAISANLARAMAADRVTASTTALNAAIAAETVAVGRATAAHTTNTAAIASQAAAATALTEATVASTVAGRASASMLTALGGPIGAVITALGLAATAWFVFGESSETATEKALNASKRVKEGLNGTADDMRVQTDALMDVNNQIKKLEETLANWKGGIRLIDKEVSLAELKQQKQAIEENIENLKLAQVLNDFLGDNTGDRLAKFGIKREAPKDQADDKKAAQEAKKLEQLKKAAQDYLNVVAESNMSQEQLDVKHYNESLAKLKGFLDAGAITREQYQAGVLNKNEAFNNKILDDIAEQFAKEEALALAQQTKEDANRTKRIEDINAIIEETKNAGMTELELMDAQHAAKMNKMAELMVGEEQRKEELRQAALDAEAQHQSKRLDLMLGTGSKIQELNKAFQKGQLQGSLSFFAADFGGMSQHSRKMFELTKAARLADAAMSIPSTVIEAARQGTAIGGWPLGAAMGAAALAAQLGQLRAIQSASFGGGSSGGGGGAGVGASGAASAEPQQQQPIMQRFVNVSVFGEENTMYSRDSVLKLMQRIGEEVKDGAVLRVV